jgi:hypothetical protein
MRNIGLTSPHTKASRVARAQHALHHNRFEDFHPGKVDGVYGEKTAAACARAKYRLGFKKRNTIGRLGHTYGAHLHAILTGERKLTPAQHVRRHKRRLARALKLRRRQTPLHALHIAIGELGQTENPANSNRTKYGKWYGLDGNPWCAMFVSWCMNQAGVPFKYAYCPSVVADARAGRNGLSVVPFSAVEAGDLALYDWPGESPGLADHIGIVERKTTGDGFTAIEGNTSFGNDSNGGKVMRRDRTTSLVLAFVRVHH